MGGPPPSIVLNRNKSLGPKQRGTVESYLVQSDLAQRRQVQDLQLQSLITHSLSDSVLRYPGVNIGKGRAHRKAGLLETRLTLRPMRHEPTMGPEGLGNLCVVG